MLDGFQLVDAHLHAAGKTTLKLPWDTWVQGFGDRDVMDRLYDSSGAVVPPSFDALLAGEGVDIGLLMCEYSPKVTGCRSSRTCSRSPAPTPTASRSSRTSTRTTTTRSTRRSAASSGSARSR